MALEWGEQTYQYVEFQKDVSIDNLPKYTIMAWVQLSRLLPLGRSATIFCKAHAKEFDVVGTDATATPGCIYYKQNKSTGLIEVQSNSFFTSTTEWYFVCAVIDADAVNPNPQAWLYGATLSTELAELPYFVRTTAYGGTLEDDAVDSQQNTPGTLIIGNKPWRAPWNGIRSWYGKIATVGFWSTNLSFEEIQRQYRSFYPVVGVGSTCELYTHLGYYPQFDQGRGQQIDLSGRGRFGHSYRI